PDPDPESTRSGPRPDIFESLDPDPNLIKKQKNCNKYKKKKQKKQKRKKYEEKQKIEKKQ
uniref:Uncharacterized protein n=1 Tax=Romanomermis culicivorax TaxID=13658 RepID=A0A915I0F9_ROMCU